MRKSKTDQTGEPQNNKLTLPTVAYDIFAPFYDHYMAHVDYDRWTAKILSLSGLHSHTKPQDILELACGTASISERLVGMGYNVTASDRSPEMLKYAAQKEHAPVLQQADMTDSLPAEAFDLILLTFDSINYLLEKEEVSRLFDNVAQSLRKQGLFIFDVSTYKNSIENFSNYLNLDETKDYTLIHRADFDSEHRLQKSHLTIFQRSDNHYIRLEEEHRQRVYYVQELLTLLAESPLDCLGVYSMVYDKNLLSTNSRKLDHQYSRLFFVCRQRKGA
jgi:SAM-dependent methyltransferase